MRNYSSYQCCGAENISGTAIHNLGSGSRRQLNSAPRLRLRTTGFYLPHLVSAAVIFRPLTFPRPVLPAFFSLTLRAVSASDSAILWAVTAPDPALLWAVIAPLSFTLRLPLQQVQCIHPRGLVLFLTPRKIHNQCCGSGMFIPDPQFSIPDPGSKIFLIPDPDPYQRI
jgi:hypothetical protein